MAHKLGAGSTKNNRDSKPKYLGQKKFIGNFIKNNSIVLKQQGLNYYCFNNIRASKNFNLLVEKDGILN